MQYLLNQQVCLIFNFHRIGRPDGVSLRIFPEFIKSNFDRSLKLWIFSFDYVRRRLLYFNIGRNSDILDDKPILSPNSKVRRSNTSAVQKFRESQNTNQASPRPRADHGAYPKLSEHPWKHRSEE